MPTHVLLSLHWAAFVRLIDDGNSSIRCDNPCPSRASAVRIRQQYSGHSIASLWFIGCAAALRNAFGIDSVHYTQSIPCFLTPMPEYACARTLTQVMFCSRSYASRPPFIICDDTLQACALRRRDDLDQTLAGFSERVTTGRMS